MSAASSPAVSAEHTRNGPIDSLAAIVRANRLFVGMLGVGAVVRVLAMIAYTPALFFGDSWGYVVSAFAGHPVALSNLHPNGYPALLRLLTLPGRDLVQLVAVQHAAGLLTGTLVYGALVRRRVPQTAAAVAAALVLLDGYAIALEQYVMADSFFTLTLLVAALLIAWPPGQREDSEARVSMRVGALSGLVLAAAILMRTAGVFAIPAFAGYLLWTRVSGRALVAFAVMLALPLLAYAGAEDMRFGTFGLSQAGGWLNYGRVAGFADCAGAGIAPGSRALCETSAQRHSHPDAPTWYIFSPDSPAVSMFGGYGQTGAAQEHSNSVLGAFARRIELHQPLSYLSAVTTDVLHYFTPGATPFDDSVSATALPRSAAAEQIVEDVRRPYLPSVNPRVRSPAGLVHAYRELVHVPRPLLALLALASLLALALRVPARREVLLLSGSGLLLVIGTSASAGFELRYLMPVVPLLAIGGTLAVRDLLGR